MSEIRVEVDYNGNTYIRYGQKVYNIFFDVDSHNGIEIIQITDSAYKELVNILEDNSHIANHIIKGKIVLSDSTLKGRVTQMLSELETEDLDDEVEHNLLNSLDMTFKEEGFFRVVRCDDDDDENDLQNDWDIVDTEEKYNISSDIEYRFSDVNVKPSIDNVRVQSNRENVMRFSDHIFFARYLSEMLAHNDTIMIRGGNDSKFVTSCVQKTDGFCTRRLVFYSDCCEIKVQFPSSHSIRLRVVDIDGDLNLEFIERIVD